MSNTIISDGRKEREKKKHTAPKPSIQLNMFDLDIKKEANLIHHRQNESD